MGRTWDLSVASPSVAAWQRFAQLMTAHRYLFRESAGGTYNCRPISGSSSYSLHAYGLAIDLNPSKNPHRKPLRHDFPAAFIRDVEAVTAPGGRRVFVWGGRWSTPDAMHFQIGATAGELAKLKPPSEEDDVTVAELEATLRKVVPPLVDAALTKLVPGMVDKELRDILAANAQATTSVSRTVWGHIGRGAGVGHPTMEARIRAIQKAVGVPDVAAAETVDVD